MSNGSAFFKTPPPKSTSEETIRRLREERDYWEGRARLEEEKVKQLWKTIDVLKQERGVE